MSIKTLKADDATAYQEIRLLSLKTDPDSFLSVIADETIKTPEYFRQKIVYATKFPVWGYWGYFENTKLVGYLQIADGYFFKKRHMAFLYELYVIPEFRKKGVASHLVKHIIGKLEALSEIEKVELKVNSKNINAITFYEKMGFKKVATLPSSVKEEDGSHQDEYVYNYLLNSSASNTDVK